METKYKFGTKIYDVRKNRDSAMWYLRIANGNHSKYIPPSKDRENINFHINQNKDIVNFYKNKHPETTYEEIINLAKKQGGYKTLL